MRVLKDAGGRGAIQLNVRKAVYLSMITNGMQILLVVAIALYVVFSDSMPLDIFLVRAMVLVASLVVIVGAGIDIRDAISTRRMVERMDDMNDTIDNMEQLNNTLRSQRHDFLNHLQVVYSLMEMGETQEANAYIEKVYGAITAVSRVMKTANPAINALLQVKIAAAEKAKVQVEMNIQSSWKNLPIPGWEMCKVLGNLIDNALDALQEVEPSERRLAITLTEDLHAFRFSVQNSGPMIPPANRQTIFQPGVTTKATGHGMGLYIVRKVLCDQGGDITLESDGTGTTFTGFLPKVWEQHPPETAA